MSADSRSNVRLEPDAATVSPERARIGSLIKCVIGCARVRHRCARSTLIGAEVIAGARIATRAQFCLTAMHDEASRFGEVTKPRS